MAAVTHSGSADRSLAGTSVAAVAGRSVAGTEAYLDLDHELVTGEAVGLDLRPASFVLRAAGAIIDFVAHVLLLIGVILLTMLIAEPLGIDDAMFAAVSIAAVVICLVVVPTAVELATRGRSLGKFAVGVRVVRDDGGAIGFRHAFVRALTGLLEVYLSFGGLAAVFGLLNTRAKRLGDLLAGTYGQHERIPKAVPPSYGMPLELTEWAQTADVARMPDALARRISAFLAQAPRFTPATRERLARELAAEASVYASPLPAVHAELFLAGVAVLRREREARALQLSRQQLDALAPTLDALPHQFPRR